MSSMEAPTWWADVQQDREQLAGRRAVDEWLDDDIDFTPRRRTRRRGPAGDPAPAADHPLHGVFVPAAAPRTIELVRDEPAPEPQPIAAALERIDAGEDAFMVPPPPIGQRRTVQIKGRPGEAQVVSRAQRFRPRTTADRVGRRPDRIALWIVVLGAILIILAALNSSAQAAELAHHARALSGR